MPRKACFGPRNEAFMAEPQSSRLTPQTTTVEPRVDLLIGKLLLGEATAEEQFEIAQWMLLQDERLVSLQRLLTLAENALAPFQHASDDLHASPRKQFAQS